MHTNAIGFEQHGLISVVHLATPSRDTLEYVSGSAAIAAGELEVTEVSETGSVNRLEVRNSSGRFVFMMDGDMLEGAKQTRVLNTSVFFPPRSRTVVPVSCVEQGRWGYTSRNFSSYRSTAPPDLRARKSNAVLFSLRERSAHAADQQEVWDRVRRYDAMHEVDSPTMSLKDTYDKLEPQIDRLVGAFSGCDEANGFALFAGRQLLCVDVFNRRSISAEYLPRVLRSVAVESVHLDGSQPLPPAAEAQFRAVDLLDRIGETDMETHPAVALGVEKRFNLETATGFRLEYDELLVHFTALALEKT